MSAPEPSPKSTAPGDVRLQWPGDDGSARRADPAAAEATGPPVADAAPAGDGTVSGELAALRRAVEDLRAEVAGLRAEVTGLRRRLPVRATDR